MSDFFQILGVAIAAAGGIVGGLAAWQQSRTSHKLGVRENDIAAEQAAVSGFQALTTSHVAEIQRLAADRDAIVIRLGRVEKYLEVEQGTKRAAIAHIRALYSWIAEHMPGANPPAIPAELSEHITLPRKDTPS